MVARDRFFEVITVVLLVAVFSCLSYADDGPGKKGSIAGSKKQEVTSMDPDKMSVEEQAARDDNASNIDLLLSALHKKDEELLHVTKENARLADEISLLKNAIESGKKGKVKDESRMLYNMGCVYREAGSFKKAERSFLEALKLDPNDADTHYNLAVLYEEDFNNKIAAINHYKLFLEIAPDDVEAARVREWLEGAQ